MRPNVRAHDPGIAVIEFWTNCYEAMRFSYEAQVVISARLMLLASGDPSGAAEVGLMISEKILAFTDAQAAAEQALADGRSIYAAAEEAYLPLRRCVHANSQRLAGAQL